MVKLPEWIALEQQPPRQSGELLGTEVIGRARYDLSRRHATLRIPRAVPLLRIGDSKTAGLDGDVLTCRSCAERYNVRFAGRSIGDEQLHLEPIPLLESGSGVRIAIAVGTP